MSREVILCEHAGFCFGAERGYNAVEEALKENVPLYTYGPILNNKNMKNYNLDFELGKLIFSNEYIDIEI